MEGRRELGFEFCCIIDAVVEEVFAAITDKAAISTFFTDASSASLEAGKTVFWRFDDLEIDVHVEEVVLNERIVCNWPACNDVGYRTRFVFAFEAQGEGTKVFVSESGWRADGEGITSAFEQCSGWTHVFASLKARLEHGVDLKDFYCAHD